MRAINSGLLSSAKASTASASLIFGASGSTFNASLMRASCKASSFISKRPRSIFTRSSRTANSLAAQPM